MIVLTAIEESRQMNELYIHEIQQKALYNEWNIARNTFMESLGHRAHKWTPATASGGFNFSSSATSSGLFGGRGETLDHHPPSQSQPFESSFIQSPYYNKASASAKKGKSISVGSDAIEGRIANEGGPAGGMDRPVLPKVISSHADCVRKISQHQSNYLLSRHESIHPCKLLLSSLKEITSNPSSDGQTYSLENATASSTVLPSKDLIGYRSILSLLSSMTGEDYYGSDVIPGYFSSVCIDPSLIDPLILKEKKNKLSKGAKTFFENQFLLQEETKAETWLKNKEIELFSRSSGKTIQMKLQKLIQFEYRMNMIPKSCKVIELTLPSAAATSNDASVTSTLRNIPIWALLYSYLRSGNMNFAISELTDLVLKYGVGGGVGNVGVGGGEGGGSNDIYYHILCLLKAINGDSTENRKELRSPRGSSGSSNKHLHTPSHASFSSSNTSASSSSSSTFDVELIETSMKYIKSFYQKEITKEESTIDPYLLFLLNLIGLIDYRDLNGSLIPSFSFEDFLWSHLWFITTSRYLKEQMKGGGGGIKGSLGGMTHSPFPRKPAAVAVETSSE
jgi:hypothetical protein